MDFERNSVMFSFVTFVLPDVRYLCVSLFPRLRKMRRRVHLRFEFALLSREPTKRLKLQLVGPSGQQSFPEIEENHCEEA